MADELRKLPDVDVQMEDGKPGELTVLVNGRTVAEKKDAPPATEEVVAAVRLAA